MLVASACYAVAALLAGTWQKGFVQEKRGSSCRSYEVEALTKDATLRSAQLMAGSELIVKISLPAWGPLQVRGWVARSQRTSFPRLVSITKISLFGGAFGVLPATRIASTDLMEALRLI